MEMRDMDEHDSELLKDNLKTSLVFSCSKISYRFCG